MDYFVLIIGQAICGVVRLTKEQRGQIIAWQKKRQRQFRSIPDCGMVSEYMGRRFIVCRDAFIPCEDSQPLVENFTVKEGESVLDVCSGVGVIGIIAKLKGAGEVVCADINPSAVKSIKANSELHNLRIGARLSDVFSNVPEGDFDVITANLPFTDRAARDLVEASMWDPGLRTHKAFFAGVRDHLKQGGRIYFAQANFGAVEEMKGMASESGFSVRKIGEKAMPNELPGIFYAFELRP